MILETKLSFDQIKILNKIHIILNQSAKHFIKS